jgi:UDP-N-acetylglucosamine 2-epimerase (non-hydrolysing)
MSSAKVVLTDSGDIQEETTILKVPCITLWERAERPVTATIKPNQVVEIDTERILIAYRNAASANWRKSQVPPLWDGHAAERIVQVLLKQL